MKRGWARKSIIVIMCKKNDTKWHHDAQGVLFVRDCQSPAGARWCCVCGKDGNDGKLKHLEFVWNISPNWMRNKREQLSLILAVFFKFDWYSTLCLRVHYTWLIGQRSLLWQEWVTYLLDAEILCTPVIVYGGLLTWIPCCPIRGISPL